MLGLGLALRQACQSFDLGDSSAAGLVEAALGALFGLWFVAVLALAAKLLRRPAVLMEDLRPLPGRAGLAAATMSGMAAAGVLIPYAPGLAVLLTFAALIAQAVTAVLLVRVMIGQGAEGLVPNPTWHLSFVGIIVAAPDLAQLGWGAAAAGIFWLTLPIAGVIWGLSVVQLLRRIPPAPLRPMLAIHLLPAALLSSTAALLGHEGIAQVLAALAVVICLALVASTRWLLQGGFTPIWGAMTFPAATFCSALLLQGGALATLGAALAVLALPFVGVIAWKVLKLWPGGRLAARTNAAAA
jgi:tellurite resistance protein